MMAKYYLSCQIIASMQKNAAWTSCTKVTGLYKPETRPIHHTLFFKRRTWRCKVFRDVTLCQWASRLEQLDSEAEGITNLRNVRGHSINDTGLNLQPHRCYKPKSRPHNEVLPSIASTGLESRHVACTFKAQTTVHSPKKTFHKSVQYSYNSIYSFCTAITISRLFSVASSTALVTYL